MLPDEPASTPLRLSRRGALLAAVASSPWACRSPGRTAKNSASVSASLPSVGSAEEWGGLQVRTTSGGLRPDEQGGQAVVLLHGWGAPGDDLVPLAEALARPRTRFFVPAAPLPEMGGGRAWWHLQAADRPAHAFSDALPTPFSPHPQVKVARTAVQALLRTIRARYVPETLAIAGFSQGGMLALDVALSAEPPVDRVAVLSGVLLVDSLPALRASGQARPPVFISHGRHDPLLSFAGGERIKTVLESRGFAVTWRPFEGGHEIPRQVVEDLRRFLFDGA